MKLSRKVLAGLSAAALLAFAVGCKNDDENEDGVITVESGKASVNYDNSGATATVDETDKNADASKNPSVRRFATANIGATGTGNDHYDSICKIDYTGANGSPMGYIFALQGEGSDAKPYSFGIVGIRVKNNTTPQYYISFLKGITGSKGTTNMIEQANFGVGSSSTTEAAQFANTNEKYEYEAARYTNFSDSGVLSNGNLSVIVDVRAFADGSYGVAFYKELDKLKTDRENDRTRNGTNVDKPFKSHDNAVYDNAIGAKAGTVKIPANVVQSVVHGSDKVYTADSEGSYQTALAYYVNVLPGTKVVGTWTVPSDKWAVTAQDEAVEE